MRALLLSFIWPDSGLQWAINPKDNCPPAWWAMSSPRTLQANVYASERKVEQGDIREVEVLKGVAFTVWSWGFELILLVMSLPRQNNDLMHYVNSLDLTSFRCQWINSQCLKHAYMLNLFSQWNAPWIVHFYKHVISIYQHWLFLTVWSWVHGKSIGQQLDLSTSDDLLIEISKSGRSRGM